MCKLGLLFGHKHLKFEIIVVMHLSQRRQQMCCHNINSSSQMSWLLKGMGGGTLIGFLNVTPKTHLRVQTDPFVRRQNSNIAIELALKHIAF